MKTVKLSNNTLSSKNFVLDNSLQNRSENRILTGKLVRNLAALGMVSASVIVIGTAQARGVINIGDIMGPNPMAVSIDNYEARSNILSTAPDEDSSPAP